MKNVKHIKLALLAVTAALAMLGYLVSPIHAHCDTMDGPVVKDAQKAIADKKVDGVLKWVRQEDETMVRAGFDRTMAVRGASDQAGALADQFFFETVVRVHRAAEGAPYTGLKPAGTPVEPGIEIADEALEHLKDDLLIEQVTKAVTEGIRQRFQDTLEKKQHADESVAAGRAYVDAYVDFVHYVAALEQVVQGQAAHSEHASEDAAAHEEK